MKAALILAAAVLAGCQPVGQSKVAQDDPFPAGTQKFVAPGNYIAWVIPITMDRGERCVLVVKNSQGTAIDCDFSGVSK